MRRVDGVMREVIGATIGAELHDPRIGFVTITAVDTSPDLSSAQVHVSVLGTDEERDATMEALRAARGVIQKAISSQLRLKRDAEPEVRLRRFRRAGRQAVQDDGFVALQPTVRARRRDRHGRDHR